VAADALATLRGAFAPFAQEPKWTTEHSMKYPSKAAQIINAVRDLLASAPQTGAQEQSEWDIRGQLAAKLTCWHRLTGNEAAELVALAKSWGAPQPAVAAGWRDISTFSEDEADELIAWKPGVGRVIVTWLPDGHPNAEEGEGWHEVWSHKRVRGITHGCLPPLPPAPSTEGESNG
jgi:hypothetical protein